ncbi:M23 family metallopeptidase [Actinoplanes sp. NEAU-H7]|uniref:M23 family metallopeptidase n=1 Tax=Actinoplanes flavus TaxID=2820290 RepID=A0ABS3UK31_9ACTN|nr:M23 family metallopeptidase [Actinoplanes flavus]
MEVVCEDRAVTGRPNRTAWILGIGLAAVIVVTGAIVLPRLRPPGPRPAFQLPVTCGETWVLGTYPGHDDFDIDFFPTSGQAWGRPVLASSGGTVVEAGLNGTLGSRTPDNPKGPHGTGAGYWVKIDHGGRWETVYLHLLEPPAVAPGDRVTTGQRIGLVGSTGKSGAPHLHYEQVRAGAKVESHFDGAPAGITTDDREYSVERTSRNCG